MALFLLLASLVALAGPAERAHGQQHCDAGELDECHAAGIAMVYGDGVPVDQVGGSALVEQACELGRARSCTALGWMYVNGRGRTWNPKAALRLWLMACTDGDPRGCASYGQAHLWTQDAFKRKPKVAEAYLLQACDADLAYGCRILGQLDQQGALRPPDPARAMARYEQACDLGDRRACGLIGLLHQHGLGVAPDLDAAVRHFRGACDAGDGSSCARLAVLELSGHPVDLGEAPTEYLRRGCNDKSASACAGLGLVYMRGIGRPADPTYGGALLDKACGSDAARDCLWRGCELAVGEACTWLADGMEDGLLGPPDRKRIKALRARACDQGVGDACR